MKEFGFPSVSKQQQNKAIQITIQSLLYSQYTSINKINHERKMVSKQIISVKLAITVQYIASYVNHK